MAERNEITVRADLPEVTETPYRVQVQCGQTAVSVHEHGVQGSGSWAVWTSGGHLVGDEDKRLHPTREQALTVAREYVRREERSRLLHGRLRVALAEVSDVE